MFNTKYLSYMKEIFLYLWQLPQNLLGLILLAIYRPEKMLKQYNGVYVYFSSKFPSGISLGKYSILNDIYYRGSSKLNTSGLRLSQKYIPV